MSKDEFWVLFALGPFVQHLDGVFARLEKLDVSMEPAPSPVAPVEHGEG
jgi:hypothetical protein